VKAARGGRFYAGHESILGYDEGVRITPWGTDLTSKEEANVW